MLLIYCWNDELEDYAECEEGIGGNSREGHIFESMVVLDNFIEGTSHAVGYHLENYNDATNNQYSEDH